MGGGSADEEAEALEMQLEIGSEGACGSRWVSG